MIPVAEAALSLASSLWRVASALVIIGIGLASLKGGRARPRSAFAFAAFAITWGLQIGVGNATVLGASVATASKLYLAFVALSLASTFFLVDFTAAQAPAHHPAKAWKWVRFGAAAFSLVGALLLIFDPSAFITSASLSASGRVLVERGPLFEPLAFAQFGAFALALGTLWSAWRATPTPRTALRTATLLVGLGVYVSNTAGYYLTRYGGNFAFDGTTAALPYIILFGGLAVFVAILATRTWHARQFHRTAAETQRANLILLALVVPGLWGAVEGLLNHGPLPKFSTQGLWRIAGMTVIAYGLARWRLPDLPARAGRAAATGAGVSTAAMSGAAIFGVATLLALTPAIAALIGVIVAGFTLVPGVRFARRLLSLGADKPTNQDALYGQRVDAYRAAVEASLARGTLEEDEDFLTALRERFGITDSEDRLLRHYASACILAPRQGDATAAYDRLRLLGEGGAGRTWLARDRVRDRLVVLKEPLERWQREPGLRETVLREARLAARVRHANVIRVEEVIEHRGAPIIVMEFAEGGSLSDLLRRRGVLPWQEALELALPVLRGVDAIHQAGIIHRDLKPSNVLLTFEGEPKIADFGIATAARASQASASNSRTVVDGFTFVGTLAYLAPEVRAGAAGDKRADVYACAAMLHEMLYGSPPGLEQPVLAKNDVPDELSRTLARALSPEAAQRPPSARALAEELTTLRARAPRQ